jgi:hypothetical protein
MLVHGEFYVLILIKYILLRTRAWNGVMLPLSLVRPEIKLHLFLTSTTTKGRIMHAFSECSPIV